MRLVVHSGGITIELSEKNLNDLVIQGMEYPQANPYRGGIVKSTEDGMRVAVVVAADEVHYNHARPAL